MRRPFASIVSIALALVFGMSVAFAATRFSKAEFCTDTDPKCRPSTASSSGTNMLAAGSGVLSAGVQAASQSALVGWHLTAFGSETGVGNGTENHLTADAYVLVSCINQGGNMAPGQNPPKVSVDGSQTLGVQDVSKNGSATFSVTTADADLSQFDGLAATQMGCPNDNWTASITGLRFINATLTAVKDGRETGKLVRYFE